MLAVMGDQRLKGFESVPTLKERRIDLAIGTWRGLGAPRGLPPDVLAKLSEAAMKAAQDPAVKEAMDKLNLGYSVADGARFKAEIDRDSAYFKALITQLNLKVN
jgi:tripartite-type tricarboxylate transporter receptor subunit TctC